MGKGRKWEIEGMGMMEGEKEGEAAREKCKAYRAR